MRLPPPRGARRQPPPASQVAAGGVPRGHLLPRVGVVLVRSVLVMLVVGLTVLPGVVLAGPASAAGIPGQSVIAGGSNPLLRLELVLIGLGLACGAVGVLGLRATRPPARDPSAGGASRMPLGASSAVRSPVRSSSARGPAVAVPSVPARPGVPPPGSAPSQRPARRDATPYGRPGPVDEPARGDRWGREQTRAEQARPDQARNEPPVSQHARREQVRAEQVRVGQTRHPTAPSPRAVGGRPYPPGGDGSARPGAAPELPRVAPGRDTGRRREA